MITNTREVFNVLSSIPENWPKEYKDKITIDHIQEWYPENYGGMRGMYHPCATERLFIPKLLSKEEAIIYVDTDIIFMRPPENLWLEFDAFNSNQAVSMAIYQKAYRRYERNTKVS